MKKIRTLVAAALLVLPMMTLDASTLTSPNADTSIKPTRAGTCWVNIGGHWFPYTC
jgi:hypothetical protein